MMKSSKGSMRDKERNERSLLALSCAFAQDVAYSQPIVTRNLLVR